MPSHFVLVSLRLLIVFLGAIIIYLAYKSHRKNRSSAMLLLSAGFTLITVGVVVEGLLFEFLNFDLFEAHTVESILVALGFGTILYSIYGTKT